MANRKIPIHQTAAPLFRIIREGRFTRAQAAKILGCTTQNVSMMAIRGIPPARVSDIAAICGMGTDEYRLQAGMIPGAMPVPPESAAMTDFALLPSFLQSYIQQKVNALLRHYDRVPLSIRKRLIPPENREQYDLWLREIEPLVLRLGQDHPVVKAKPAPVKKKAKVSSES